MKKSILASLICLFVALPAISLTADVIYKMDGGQLRRVNERGPSRNVRQPFPIDRERYNLGLSVYRDEIELPKEPISPELLEKQMKELKILIKGLPKKEAKKLDIDKISGRLNDKEYIALKYYLFVRFEVLILPEKIPNPSPVNSS